MPKILGLGHSVMRGVGYGGVAVADTFLHKIGIANGYTASDIINKGVSSDTSAGALARLATDVISQSPSVCVIMLGANDWSKSVPVATFRANMLEIVRRLQIADVKVVLLTDNASRGSVAQFNAYYPYIEAIKEVAAERKCHLVDLYGRMLQAMMASAYLPFYVDSIHLTVAGHNFVASYAAKSFHDGYFVK